MDVGIRNALIRVAGDTRPLETIYQDYFDRIVLAEQLGYDFIWFGEHHFMANQWNPSPLLALATIAGRTSRLRLGTSVLLTPFYNPLRLAEDVAQLDVQSHGRVDLVCGTASITGEFETFGVEPAERFGRTFETLAFVRRCFSEARFDHRGRYYRFPNVRLTTQPVQRPFPLWFGGFGPRMLRRAGREGYHLQTGAVDPAGPYGEYLAGLREGGHAAGDFNLATMARFVVVATQAEVPAARERALAAEQARREEYSPRGRDLAFQFRAGPTDGATSETDEHAVLGIPVGTPDQVLRQLEPRWKTSPVTHLETSLGSPATLELIARELLPTLKTWGRTPVRQPALQPTAAG
jgi:alkanesulfonate monooxygenase SsuD/methylene tetrahydromethanopterin reductase-like flavin-dependent oxidoreductase (luciferase family)